MCSIRLAVLIVCIIIWRDQLISIATSRLVATLFKAFFQYLQIALKATINKTLSLIQQYNEYLQKQSPRDGTTQTPDCEGCARLQHRVNDLEADLQRHHNTKRDFGNDIHRVLHGQKAELEAQLDAANTELERSGRFLREAETQANSLRAEIRSLREQLRLARDGNSADVQKSLALQREIERLQEHIAQLTASNLQQREHALRQKQRALGAERELDVWAEKIKTLVDDRSRLCRELDRKCEDVRRLERAVGAQREGRIRADVENEELRRPRAAWRWNGQAVFT